MAGDGVTRVRVLRDNDAARGFIKKREPFQTRTRKTNYGTFVSISGGPSAPSAIEAGPYGNLPRMFWESVDLSPYVVRSYQTPIAWWLTTPADLRDTDLVDRWLDGAEAGHWVMPAIRYSLTTTEHQSLVRAAIGYDVGTAYESTDYKDFAKVPSGCERSGW